MSKRKKSSPIENFEANIADAFLLVNMAAAFQNKRVRRMRSELRNKIGSTLRVPKRKLDQLACIESQEIFMVFYPDAKLNRQDFDDRRPLLRQSIVAACAAGETYFHDLFMNKVGHVVRSANDIEQLPGFVRDIPMTVGTWWRIRSEYLRDGWGLREMVLKKYAAEYCSTAPNKVGKILSAIGIERPMRRIDQARGRKSGTTESQLEQITERRNQIAHHGDRRGHGRAQITVKETSDYLDSLRDIVHCVEKITN